MGEETREQNKNSDNETQTIFKVFGIELTAPANLKNPRVIYLSFVVVNIVLFMLIRQALFAN